MPTITGLQNYPALTGGELIPCYQFGAPEDGFIVSRDLVNLFEVVGVIPDTGYTFTTGDEKRIIEFTSASSVIGAIPNDTTTNFPIGTTLRWVQIGVGRIFFGAAVGVTVRWPQDNSNADCKRARKINSSGTFRKRAANDWHAIGDLSST